MLIRLCSLILLFLGACASNKSSILKAPTAVGADISIIIEQALTKELSKVNTYNSKQTNIFCEEAMKKVKEADYIKAIEIVLLGLSKFPGSFKLQYYLAALLGDSSEIVAEPLKSRIVEKSKTMFDKLLLEADKQPKDLFYHFKNEYFYRFALYRQQYLLGLERVAHYWEGKGWDAHGIKGYYCQGVGAANYAKELLLRGDKESAHEYAQKALVAWAQYFSYENDYYNAYVHYALAVGILGYREEMLRALQRSAAIIGRDLNYSEFKEIIEFFGIVPGVR